MHYFVIFDEVTGTWDIWFRNYDTGYERFVSEHYDQQEANEECEYRNSHIHPLLKSSERST